MTDWTANELDRVGAADELEIAPYRRDGSALHSRLGRIGAGGVEREVSFAEPAGQVAGSSAPASCV
jgi:hypothetical protein